MKHLFRRAAAAALIVTALASHVRAQTDTQLAVGCDGFRCHNGFTMGGGVDFEGRDLEGEARFEFHNTGLYNLAGMRPGDGRLRRAAIAASATTTPTTAARSAASR